MHKFKHVEQMKSAFLDKNLVRSLINKHFLENPHRLTFVMVDNFFADSLLVRNQMKNLMRKMTGKRRRDSR